MERSGVALVTTVWLGGHRRGSRHVEVLEAFLIYHFSIGVDRAIVFFDGDATQQPTVESLGESLQSLAREQRIEFLYRCPGNERTEVATLDEKLRFSYADCANYEKLRDAMASDVASRQLLHAEMAMQRCQQLNVTSPMDRVRWLLHLDIDELFYCEGMADKKDDDAASVFRSFIAAVEAETPAIDQVTVVNYEAVPTATLGGNYFLSAVRFRRHTARIALSSESQQAIRDWQSRSPHGHFFLFYDNGKSLVRVPNESNSVVPASVHHWRPVQRSASSPWRSVSNFYDPRRSDLEVWHEPTPDRKSCILHYPVCGVEWLREKYERLGAFASVWGGNTGTHRITIQPCFHLDARDAVASGRGQIEKLYSTQVVVSEDNEGFWSRQLAAGVCDQITFPRELLMTKGFRLVESEREPSQKTQDAIEGRLPIPRDESSGQNGFTVEKAWMLAAISDQYV